MEDGQVTVLLLFDFSQAFDMVVYGLLLCKPQNAHNYSVGAGMLVGSDLGERVQFVRYGGQETSVGAGTCGFPQGSVLGPLLFISYINDVIRFCRFHTCAVSDFQKCIDELNLDLQRVHEWAAANRLKLNPIKSQVIVISRCRVDIPPTTLLMGSDVIKVVSKVNNLGFVLK
jgi:ribonucleases P/MRP protein subunit RPP40